MVDPVDTSLWPLYQLASCGHCGALLQPRPMPPSRRFYGCACPDGLHDADDLEDAVAGAVIEHMGERLTAHAFRADRVRAAWRNADPAGRRSILTAALAAVNVNPAGDLLSYVWHTE